MAGQGASSQAMPCHPLHASPGQRAKHEPHRAKHPLQSRRRYGPCMTTSARPQQPLPTSPCDHSLMRGIPGVLTSTPTLRLAWASSEVPCMRRPSLSRPQATRRGRQPGYLRPLAVPPSRHCHHRKRDKTSMAQNALAIKETSSAPSCARSTPGRFAAQPAGQGIY